jgi:phosphoribosylpyrophosphate synthetase
MSVNKDVILIDDIIDTGVQFESGQRIKELGAKSVRQCLHMQYYRIMRWIKLEIQPSIKLCERSIPLKRQSSKFEVISFTYIFAEVIKVFWNKLQFHLI